MKICLINASNPVNTQIEWDEYVDFRDGYEACFDGNKMTKMCRSWHSLPAVLGTEFFVYNKPGWQGVFKYDGVMVLVNRDLDHVVPLIKKLKLARKKVLVGYHENLDDFLLSSQNPAWTAKFIELVNMCDGQLNVIPQAEYFFEGLHDKPIMTTYHANPYKEWNHGFTVPFEEREGLMVATRTFNQRLRRNTLFALSVANKMARDFDTFVTYVSEDGWDEQELMKLLRFERVKALKGPFEYEEWLQIIAKHKIIIHADMAGTLGQVVTDAALVDVVAVGGTTDNNLAAGTYSRLRDLSYVIGMYYDGKYNALPLSCIKKMTSSEIVGGKIQKFFEDLE